MQFLKCKPPYPLSNYVDSLQYVNGNTKGIGLPKTALSIVFNIQDHFRLYSDDSFKSYSQHKKYWIAGLQMSPRYVESYGQSEMMIVQFKTLGAYELLGVPLVEYKNYFIGLDLINSELANQTWERLCESKSISEMFSVGQEFLASLISDSPSLNYKSYNAINLLLKKESGMKVRDMCLNLGVSRKHLNYLFNTYVGVSPKSFLQLKRFRKSLQLLSQSKIDCLTNLAYEIGYFDQPHFINDFKKMTGLTPTDYVSNSKTFPSMQSVPHFIPQLSR